MLSVHLICVGKLKEKFYLEAAAEYQKRLSAYCRLTLVELPEEKLPQNPTQGQIDQALSKEAQAIRAKLPPSASVIALCVEGKERSSEDFAKLLSTWEHSSAKHLVFVIGGSYGLDPALKAEAWVRLSMSPMTFPTTWPGSCCWSSSTGRSRSRRGPATTNRVSCGEGGLSALVFSGTA